MIARQTILWATVAMLALPAVVHAQFILSTNNGRITIAKYTGSGGDIIIPKMTNGMPVTRISFQAFEGFANLTNVTIPSNVTEISNGAFFNCFSLTAITVDAGNPVYSSLGGALFNKNQTMLIQYRGGKIDEDTIPKSVTGIGDLAFVTSTGLTSVTIPSSVISIGIWAFRGCTSLTNVTIGTNVTSIGENAFEDCTSLTSVTIPGSVTSIDFGAFSGCSRLTNVAILCSVSSLSRLAFYGCRNLSWIDVNASNPSFSSVGGVMFDKSQTTLIHYPMGLSLIHI